MYMYNYDMFSTTARHNAFVNYVQICICIILFYYFVFCLTVSRALVRREYFTISNIQFYKSIDLHRPK